VTAALHQTESTLTWKCFDCYCVVLRPVNPSDVHQITDTPGRAPQNLPFVPGLEVCPYAKESLTGFLCSAASAHAHGARMRRT
jgi:hypothetical protein